MPGDSSGGRETLACEGHFKIIAERHFTIAERHFNVDERHFKIAERHFKIAERHFKIVERHFKIAERHAPSVATDPALCSPFAYTPELLRARRRRHEAENDAVQVAMCQKRLEILGREQNGPPCCRTAQAVFGYFFPEFHL